MQLTEIILKDELARTAKYYEYLQQKLEQSIQEFCAAEQQKVRNKCMDKVRHIAAKKNAIEIYLENLKEKIEYYHA